MYLPVLAKYPVFRAAPGPVPEFLINIILSEKRSLTSCMLSVE